MFGSTSSYQWALQPLNLFSSSTADAACSVPLLEETSVASLRSDGAASITSSLVEQPQKNKLVISTDTINRAFIVQSYGRTAILGNENE